MASLAQSESESISKNVRWGIQKKMRDGSYVASHTIFGFRRVEGSLVIHREEAEYVRYMFKEYLAGKNAAELAQEMMDKSRTDPVLQSYQWSYKTIMRLLRNEKYAGDSLHQKTFMTETLPRRCVDNHADTEIIITFMGAFAQSESESISKNVSWGKRQAMREGKACIHYKRLYGYRKGEADQPEIIPEQGEIVLEIGQRYLLGDSLRMIRDWLNRRDIPYLEGKEWTITNIRSILTNEKYRGDVLMQKTFVQDCISKKVVKNTGQLPQYLIENNHPAIFSREMGCAIDAEMARRNAIQSPSVKNQQTGQSHYSAKYALSERLVCGECGTLYRRCTWTSRGQKRIVWRCVNRLDHGTKYCKTSPTMPEDPLQEAILKALNTAMSGKDLLSNLIMDALETEMCILPDSKLSLNGIQRRMEELESEFQDLLGKAAEEGAESLTQQFGTITEEIASLKIQREQMVQQLRENGLGTQKLEKARMVLTGVTADFTTWQEDTIRRFVHTVKVLSADHIKIYLNNGAEIDQEVRA